MLSMLHLALGILRCPTRWQWSFCATATPSINISQSAQFATVGASSSRSYVGLWGSSCFFLFPQALPLGAWEFLLSLNHDLFASQLQRVDFLRKGSHEGPLFRMFPRSLQSIISNQMRPRWLKGAWFSRLLRHPARKRSGSILSPRTCRTYSYQFLISSSSFCANSKTDVDKKSSYVRHSQETVYMVHKASQYLWT